MYNENEKSDCLENSFDDIVSVVLLEKRRLKKPDIVFKIKN